MPYKFIYTPDPDNEFDIYSVEVGIPHNELQISKIFETFEAFLKAAGWSPEAIQDYYGD